MSVTITAINLISLQLAFGFGSAKSYQIFKLLDENSLIDKPNLKVTAQIFFKSKEVTKLLAVGEEKVLDIVTDCRENGIEIITIKDERYPERLRNISVPPLVLYIKGSLPDIDRDPMFGIVGPRKLTEYGAKAAYSLAMRLSKGGMTIVSGGAMGADTYAHRGALKAGGKTVAVLGCGIEYPYLMQNAELRKCISQNGCLISEYPPFEKCTKYTFPIRNRIVAGLSAGIAVIEAGAGSGSLITARYALEQGKEVFAIPGKPEMEQYAGSNALFEEGAIPLMDAKSILNRYEPRFADKIDIKRAYEKTDLPKNKEVIQKNSAETLSKAAKIVYNYLDRQKFTADDLLGAGVSDDELLSSLTELEMEHLIRALPGGIYELIK